jgi:trans-aconitate methyltransferase
MEHFISNNEQNLLHWNIILRWIIRLYMLMPKLLAYVLGLLAFTKPNNYSDPIFPQLSEVMYDCSCHADDIDTYNLTHRCNKLCIRNISWAEQTP